MHPSETNRKSRSTDPEWHLLFVFSIQDLLTDIERKSETATLSLFRFLNYLGVSPDLVENIPKTIAGFAKKAEMHDEQETRNTPEQIRIFCQKKLLNEAIPTDFPMENLGIKDQAQNFSNIKADRLGGWGYFIIERSEKDPSSSPNRNIFIDLFIYKEK